MAKKEQKPVDFPFGKENFMIMFIGLAVIVLGFILMSLRSQSRRCIGTDTCPVLEG